MYANTVIQCSHCTRRPTRRLFHSKTNDDVSDCVLSDLRRRGLLQSPAVADVVNGQRQISAAELEQDVFGAVDQSTTKLTFHVHYSLPCVIQQTCIDVLP